MRAPLPLLAVAGIGLALLAWRNAGPSIASSVEDVAEDIIGAVTPGPWSPPSRAAPYLSAIYAAEDAQGIPRNVLVRVLYQESRFRADIIRGDVMSGAGALGIAQLLPETAAAYRVNPLDPVQAIGAAAQELQKLYSRFGAWTDAVAAYNWGQGNWNAFLRTGKGARGQDRPSENVRYVAEIAADVRLA